MNYIQILEENNYRLCKDNIVRDNKNHPKCNNAIYQNLVEKIQKGETLDYFEEKLYGSCILSLAEIVLNNKMMKHQDEDIKEESRGQMYESCVVNVPKYFDSAKGKAYSYAFRLCYVECVHVLERHNAERKFLEELKESYEEMLVLENSGRKVCNVNIDE